MTKRRRWNAEAGAILKETNEFPITKEDLMRVVDETESAFPDSRGDLMAYAAVAKTFVTDPDTMEALMFRLQALTRFVTDEGASDWTISLPYEDVVLTPEPVFAAAAVQPLIAFGDEVTFERESFLAKVLELADLKTIG